MGHQHSVNSYRISALLRLWLGGQQVLFHQECGQQISGLDNDSAAIFLLLRRLVFVDLQRLAGIITELGDEPVVELTRPFSLNSAGSGAASCYRNLARLRPFCQRNRYQIFENK